MRKSIKQDRQIEFLIEKEGDRATRFFVALILSCSVLLILAISGLIIVSENKLSLGEMGLFEFSVLFLIISFGGIFLTFLYLDNIYKEMFIPLDKIKKGLLIERNFWGRILEDD